MVGFRSLSLYFVILFLVGIHCLDHAATAAPGGDTLTLFFTGDIMGHDAQIESAYDSVTGKFHYDDVFRHIAPAFREADFTIANLECTLAGPPYKGYPRFSSPDELAAACLNSGINVLMTANNHCCDRGYTGISRTLSILDFLGIQHTGTFHNRQHRDTTNLLVLRKGDIRVGLLNYTYGTNGLPIPAPAIVNLLDTALIRRDIESAKNENLDKILIVLHWGKEYQSLPTEQQKHLAQIIFSYGADAVIGSHPHVLQPMIFQDRQPEEKDKLVVYSLGNFISNQRKRKTDGGAVLKLTIIKEQQITRIDHPQYLLTWVWKHKKAGQWKFEIIPYLGEGTAAKYGLDDFSTGKMTLFIRETKDLFREHNKGASILNE